MQILADACLALFASIGIWTLGRMAFDWFMRDTEKPSIWIVMQISGTGEDLECSLLKLLRSRRGLGVLLVDCGLTKTGKLLADELTERYTGVWLCSQDQLGSWMKEAETWTRQKNTTK